MCRKRWWHWTWLLQPASGDHTGRPSRRSCHSRTPIGGNAMYSTQKTAYYSITHSQKFHPLFFKIFKLFSIFHLLFSKFNSRNITCNIAEVLLGWAWVNPTLADFMHPCVYVCLDWPLTVNHFRLLFCMVTSYVKLKTWTTWTVYCLAPRWWWQRRRAN